MKRRGPEIEPPPGTGPFRKMEYTPDITEEGVALEKMEKEIAAEGKFGILFPKKIKFGDPVPLFQDALKNNIDPKDIVFYSLATGVVKYDRVQEFKAGSFGRQEKYIYTSKNDPNIQLAIWVEKNKATFTAITTKEDADKFKEFKEKRDWYLATNTLKENSAEIKRLIKTGSELGLSDLKNTVESLLKTINDELEKNK